MSFFNGIVVKNKLVVCLNFRYSNFMVLPNGRQLALHGGIIKPSRQKKGGIAMVTYADLFQFVMMLVAVVSLVYKITKKITALCQKMRLFLTHI